MIDETRLLRAFLDGRDERAFRDLYRATTPPVYGLALRLAGGDEAEASEIVQETWVRALARLDRFRAGAGWTPWLRGIAVNCWRERMRRVRSRLEVELDDAHLPSPPQPVDDLLVDAAAVRAAVLALPAGYRGVLVLHDVEGYTHEEIAVLLGVTAGTSKSQLSRARARLRAVLVDGDPGSSRNESTTPASRPAGGNADAKR